MYNKALLSESLAALALRIARRSGERRVRLLPLIIMFPFNLMGVIFGLAESILERFSFLDV